MNKTIVITILSIFLFNNVKSQSDVFGQFLNFNGGDISVDGQYVNIPDHTTLDFNATESFTIQFFIKPKNFGTTNGDIHGLVTKKTNSGKGYGVFWEVNATGGRFRFLLDDGSSKSISSDYITNINSSNWTHITAVMERDANGAADSVFLYINSQLVAKDETSTIDDVSNTQPFYLMRSASNGVTSAGGYMDEVRIWRTALTEEEIHRLYNEPIENFAGIVRTKTTGRFTTLLWNKLVGYWDMEDSPSGFTISDQSQNTNDGAFYEGGTLCTSSPCGPKFLIFSSDPKETYVTKGSGNWSASATWQGGIVPNGDRAVVYVVDNHQLTLDGNFSCLDFIANINATFISGSSSILSVYQYFDIDGTFNNNFGTIRFAGNGNHNIYGESNTIEFFHFEMDQSSSQIQVNSPIVINGILYHTNGRILTKNNITLSGNTGNPNRPYGLIDPSGIPDVVGDIKMEKTLSNTNAGWRQICMPLAGTVAGFSGLQLNTSTSVNATDPNIYYWNNAQNGATPDNVGWTQASDNDDESKALTVYLENPNYAFTTDFSFIGTYNPGDQTFPLTYFNDPGNPLSSGDVGYENGVGWNFIPNNYPSLLNTSTMLTQNPLLYKSIHIWDAINQQYKAFSSSFNNIVPYNNAGVGAFIGNQAMVPFQGYWVKTESSENGFNYVLKDSWRSTAFTFAPYPSLKNIDAVQIDVFSANDSTWDAIAVAFDAGASPTFEADKDVYKIISPANVPSLFIEADKRFLQISTVPAIAQSMPLHFKAAPNNVNGTYFIHLSNFQLNPDWTVILEDKATHLKHDLRKSSYGFNAGIYTNSDRFILYFSKLATSGILFSSKVSAYFNGENIVVQNQNLNGLATVELIDISGKTLYADKVQLSDEFIIPAPKQNGIFYLRVKHLSGIYTVKIPITK